MNNNEFQRLASLNAQSRTTSLWQRALTTLAGVLTLLLAMTFSLLVFAVLLAVVAIGLIVFWWKTRALRQQLRQSAQATNQAATRDVQADYDQRTAAAAGWKTSRKTGADHAGVVIDGVATVVAEDNRDDHTP